MFTLFLSSCLAIPLFDAAKPPKLPSTTSLNVLEPSYLFAISAAYLELTPLILPLASYSYSE